MGCTKVLSSSCHIHFTQGFAHRESEVGMIKTIKQQSPIETGKATLGCLVFRWTEL